MDIYGQTLLTIYNYLEPMTSAFDRMVKKAGLLNDFVPVFGRVEDILEYTDRKIALINLKLTIDNILIKIPKIYSKILILKYFDNLSSSEISDILELNLRTYFRRLCRAEKSFSEEIKIENKLNPKIFNEIQKQQWIDKIYQRLKNKSMGSIELSKKESLIESQIKRNMVEIMLSKVL